MSTADVLEDMTAVLADVEPPEGFAPQIAMLHWASEAKNQLSRIIDECQQVICADRTAGPYEAGEWVIDIRGSKSWKWTKPAEKGDPYQLQRDVRRWLLDPFEDDDPSREAVDEALAVLFELQPIVPRNARLTVMKDVLAIDPTSHGEYTETRKATITRTP